MDRSKVQEIICHSVLEVKSENTFQGAWLGEKPSWVTAPAVVLLGPDVQHVEVVDCDKPIDEIKLNGTTLGTH